jgi:hypothetical protein
MLSRRVARFVVPLALTAACAGVGHGGVLGHPQGIRQVRPAPRTLAVTSAAGQTVTVVPASMNTVAQALAASGFAVPTGRLLSVRHRVLRGNGRPGQVRLNGQLVTGSWTVRSGDHLTLQRGLDTVEATQTVTVSVPPPTDAGLYVGSRPGRARVVRGAVSGDLVSSRTLAAPTIGRLLRPGAVALTFDDGPDPVWTPRVLKLLAHAHLHATFCLIGREAAAHPSWSGRSWRAVTGCATTPTTTTSPCPPTPRRGVTARSAVRSRPSPTQRASHRCSSAPPAATGPPRSRPKPTGRA